MSVAENLAHVRRRIDDAARRAGRDSSDVRLIAAVKGVEPPRLIEAIDAGLTDCGENVVQDAQERIEALGPDAERVAWHFIGHLQTNKVTAALRLFATIHSVDSERLAQHLSQRATGRLQVLLEVNVAGETSKFGFAPTEVAGALSRINCLPNLDVAGLMTIAPAVPDPELVRPVFRELRELAAANGLSQLSMGMTDDFEVAIEEGATMVRVGRAIFGERTT